MNYMRSPDNDYIEHGDVILIVDAEQNTISESSGINTGQTNYYIYRGQVINIKRMLQERGEQIYIQAIGLQSRLKQLIYTQAASYTGSITDEPADIIKDILDNFTDYFSYTGGSIPNF